MQFTCEACGVNVGIHEEKGFSCKCRKVAYCSVECKSNVFEKHAEMCFALREIIKEKGYNDFFNVPKLVDDTIRDLGKDIGDNVVAFRIYKKPPKEIGESTKLIQVDEDYYHIFTIPTDVFILTTEEFIPKFCQFLMDGCQAFIPVYKASFTKKNKISSFGVALIRK